MEHFKQINILKFISINLPPKPCSSSELHGFNLLKKFFKKSLDKQGTVWYNITVLRRIVHIDTEILKEVITDVWNKYAE